MDEHKKNRDLFRFFPALSPNDDDNSSYLSDFPPLPVVSKGRNPPLIPELPKGKYKDVATSPPRKIKKSFLRLRVLPKGNYRGTGERACFGCVWRGVFFLFSKVKKAKRSNGHVLAVFEGGISLFSKVEKAKQANGHALAVFGGVILYSPNRKV